MYERSPLEKSLKESLGWHQARICLMSHFIIGLIRVRTVNLTDIAVSFSGNSESSSNYRRLQRFLSGFELNFSSIARLVVSMVPLEEKWVLSLDRTNWKFGVLNINILVLAVAYNGVAIPLFWSFLNKRGNSNTSERKELLSRFIECFDKERVACLTADREFIGHEWVSYLKEEGISFRIRIRNNTKIPNKHGNRSLKAYLLFSGLQLGESMVLNQRRSVWGISLHLVGLKVQGEWLILITDQQPYSALEDYKKRWEIETLFGCLKTRGFNFEDTHLTKTERISKILALMTIAFVWCTLIGEWKNSQKKIPIKKHGRKAKSIFRLGLDHLRSILLNLALRKTDVLWATRFLSCT